jgi:hypothetical protein
MLPLPAADTAGGKAGVAAARSLVRRLALALHDLGLDVVVPAGWLSVAGATIEFAALDVPTADHLVRHLEDLAAQVSDTVAVVPAEWRRAGPGQATLFGGER